MNNTVTLQASTKRALETLFIIGAPILSFTLVTLVSSPRASTQFFLFDPGTPDWFIAFSSILTHTHVMMVFYRSHLNQNVFKRYPIRFIAAPIIVLAAFYSSGQLVAVMAVVALYWDEWHTTLQTFGFGRIYDSRLGNDPRVGRGLDIGICFVLSLFPHLLLLTYVPEDQRTMALVEYLSLGHETAERYGHWIHNFRMPLIVSGATYIIYYLWRYKKLIQDGYKVSLEKIALFSSTCFSAVLISLFYSIADSAHYFNIYHSLQYMFIVSLSEVPRLSDRFGLPGISKQKMIFASGFMVFTIALVAGVARDSDHFTFMGGFWILSSLLHFWYDGFIWSVRKQDVV